ncbi:hypothetical protein IGB42_01818 [Andreprevotia sp. IGB-42]|uniref:helix-turn-helix domain-containing protein n=1 Tax=Andreprevotia sp. IGB-42 TaxID=2497473 RepID=UPI00135A28A6|nr:helix-turn-helix transcriptional regulator [Andreprevotia sp. IGB-42]KAF0813467.1 hypothetical protein IGB42_01818 [Andreprevotia sp. IGB-42]
MNYQIKTVQQLRPILLGFRRQAGLTQAAIAAQLGITQQSYAALEANPAAASFERLFKVLRLLDVDVQLASAKQVRHLHCYRSVPALTAANVANIRKPGTPSTAGKDETQPMPSHPAAPMAVRPKKHEDW